MEKTRARVELAEATRLAELIGCLTVAVEGADEMYRLAVRAEHRAKARWEILSGYADTEDNDDNG